MDSAAFDDSFWDGFVADYWERSPLLLRQPAFSMPVSTELLFRAITDKTEKGSTDRVWVAGTGKLQQNNYTLIDFEVFGPRSQDGSLEGYFERLKKSLGKREFGVNVHGLQCGSPHLWFQLRRFLDPLIRRVGLPGQMWDLDTFLGTYGATPFGIHKDQAGNFAFGVCGHRDYYFWPPDYFCEGHPDILTADRKKFGPHLDNAIKMPVGPGDILYWPSSHWHVALSNGEPSAVFYAGEYFGTSTSVVIQSLVHQAIEQHNGIQYQKTLSSDVSRELPKFLSRSEEILRDIVESGVVSELCQKMWCKFLSADGFTSVPAPRGLRSFQSDRPYKSSLNRNIAWLPSGESLYVACNGLEFEVDRCDENERLLTRLSEGQAVTFGDESGLALLEQLYRRRGLIENA